MKLHSISTHNNGGFTLIEVIIVITMVALFAGMGLVFSFDSYKGYLFRAEYGVVVNTLQKARNRAVNNFYEMEHGVHFEDDSYTLFRGDTYVDGTATNEEYPANPNVSVVMGGSSDFDVVFEQLTGNTDDDGNISVSLNNGGGVNTRTLILNEQGGIDW